MVEEHDGRVVLMFSGGRDSTLAALRLHEAGHSLKLVTITAGHLFGLNNVERRLREIALTLPGETEWLQIVQPAFHETQFSFHRQTCLPCQSAYVIVGANVARKSGIGRIALGYVSYQAGWPEQGAPATKALELTLSRHDFELMLPVYDIQSRMSAEQELKARGVSELSFEQKCTRQVNNVVLDGEELSQQLELWTKSIDEGLSNIGQPLSISRRLHLGELE